MGFNCLRLGYSVKEEKEQHQQSLRICYMYHINGIPVDYKQASKSAFKMRFVN